jgi:hypothetical protein
MRFFLCILADQVLLEVVSSSLTVLEVGIPARHSFRPLLSVAAVKCLRSFPR